VFTGGIGENDPQVRQCACCGLEGLGLVLDAAENGAIIGRAGIVSSGESRIKVLVVPTDEELEIARQALEALA
jgi:acetate kinase